MKMSPRPSQIVLQRICGCWDWGFNAISFGLIPFLIGRASEDRNLLRIHSLWIIIFDTIGEQRLRRVL